MKKYTGLEIAVIGMSGRFPKANSIHQYWDNLKNGVEGISFFTNEEILEEGEGIEMLNHPDYVKANGFVEDKKYFDSAFFNYRPDEASLMDPQTRIFHECVWSALEDAACKLDDPNHKIGLYVGATTDINWHVYTDLINRKGLVDDFTASHLCNARFLATKISYSLGLHGPSVFLDTACSSSLVAIDQACKSLLLRDCTIAVAGGVAMSKKSKKGYVYAKGMIHSIDGHCRSYDADSTGTISSEGAGAVVLKTLKKALADGDHIHAIIRGTAINNDGHEKVGYTAPSIDGQTEVILMAQKWAKVEPQSISYIEGHGTATELGDPIEVEALNRAFGKSDEKYCALGSVKSNLGHLDSAAGVAGLIKTVLALKNRQIPPSLHYKKPNPKINFKDSPFYVNTELREWTNDKYPLRAGVSSFGIGGTNAHVILEEAPEQEPGSKSREYQLLTFSAKTRSSLAAYLEEFRAWLEKEPNVELPDMAYTLQVGRADFPYRKTIICKNKQEAIELSGVDVIPPKLKMISTKSKTKVAFMFSGQGAQYANMCFDLYEKEEVFKSCVDQCLDIIKKTSDMDLKPILFGNKEKTDSIKINNTEYTQPALFVIEYSLANLLMEWGIQPDMMIGHSIGEYVAACISGVFTLEDALALVVKRGKLMQKVPKGSMLSVSISEKDMKSYLKEHETLSMAVINNNTSCVVAGKNEAIEKFKAQLDEQGHQNRLVKTSHAFHSSMMDEILDEFRKEVLQVTISPPQIPFISNLTGELASEEDINKAEYWVNHLRHTVRFSQGLDTMFDHEHVVFIEVGPGRTLSSFLRKHPSKKDSHKAVNLVRHIKEDIDDLKYLLDGIGKLWSFGIELSWEAFYKNENRRKASLPTYSFDKISYPVHVDAYEMIMDEAAQLIAQNKRSAQNFINTVSWIRSEVPNFASELTENQFTFLVFTGTEDVSTPLVKFLISAGQAVITVKDGGHTFRKLKDDLYEARADEVEDLEKLWEALNESEVEINHMIYCRSLSKTQTTIGYDGIEDELRRGYLGLSFLGKSLAGLNHSDTIKITIVDNFLAAITQEDKTNPLKNTIKAPARVIPLELNQIECKLIDIPYPFRNDQELESYVLKIVNEIFYDSDEDFVTYRYQERWIQSFHPAENKDKLKSNISIVKDGTYIITGGLGGMGLTIAENFVQEGKANVILLYRSEFPERKDWEKWLKTTEEADPISQKIRRLIEMEKTTSKVDLHQIDLSSEEQVRQFIVKQNENNIAINGLVWAAGEIDYGGIMLNRKKSDFIKYVSSKVHALLLFEKYMTFEKLDFVSLFSSMGNVFYQTKFGQVAYNAANEFLENYPDYLKKKTGANVFTINWCDWLDTGMSFKSIQKELKSEEAHLINSKIENGITPAEGITIFHQCLKNKLPVSYIFGENISKEIEQYRQLAKVDQELPMDRLEEEILVDENTVEQKMITLFSKFFGKDDIGFHDNFFDLGGDSLSGMTLIAKINKGFGIKLTIGDLYKFSLIKDLCDHIIKNNLRVEENDIPKAPKKGYYKTTAAQKRLFFLYEFDKSSLAYNMPSVVRIIGKLDKERLNEAFNKLIARHESLRTSYDLVDNVLVQKIANPANHTLDYCRATESELPTLIDEFVRPFDLYHSPLIRAGLIQLGPQENILMIDVHHITADLVSHTILINDFLALYNEETLPELELQYKDYAEWEQSEQQQKEMAQQKAFWLNAFSESIPILDLPTDFDRPLVRKHEGRLVHFEISKKQTDLLKSIANKEGVTMYMVILAIFNILLSKLSNQDDILIGSPAAGRHHADVEQIIGMFVNTLILRNKPIGKFTFNAFLADVKQNTIQCFNNQNIAYEELIDELNIERDTSRNPLFDVMFAYQNFKKTSQKNITGLSIEPYGVEHKVAQFDLSLTAIEGEQILFNFEYATHLFRPETIEKFVAYFKKITSAIISNQNVKLKEIQILSENEKELLLGKFNDTKTSYPSDKTIHALFEEKVAENGESTALIFGEEKLSYKELNERANQLARSLQSSGAEEGDIIGIIMPRSCEMIICILSVLKIGAAYLPIDPEYPIDRIQYMVKHSGVELILSEPSQQEIYDQLEAVKLIDVSSANHSSEKKENFPANISSSTLAYLIYTSGSTGRPKGVMIEHQNVVNFVYGITKKVKLKKNDIILCLTTISFDIFVLETILPLLTGMSIVIADSNEQKDPNLLAGLIKNSNVDILQMTPSHLKLMLFHPGSVSILRQLKCILVGGEEFPQNLFDELKMNYKGEIYDVYGPTETTVWSTIKDLTLEKTVTIGQPIANTNIYIINKNQELQPIGIPGELCIGGDGVSRGYWQNLELSNERFVKLPFPNGERVYKTGDQARWLANGDIEFQGRLDKQIKLRGHRIELGEIEIQLSSHPSVIESVVLLINNNDDKFLLAYYVSDVALDANELKSYLIGLIPSYMVPAHFVHMAEMPLTANGKLNRKALPEFDPEIDRSSYVTPTTEIEKQLVEFWAELLNLEKQIISTTHSFFQLGGHSLSAVALNNKIYKTYGIEIPMKEFFSKPTLMGMAESIEAHLWLQAEVNQDSSNSSKITI